MIALLNGLGIDKFIIAGNSLGGNVGWELAVRFPDRVRGLILVDAAGYPPNFISIPLAFRVMSTPGLRMLVEYFLPKFVIRDSVHQVFGDPSKVPISSPLNFL